MIDVAAAVTTIGVLLCVAIGAVARADGVMPKPASTSTLSLTTSSCAIRRVASGTPPSSLRITSTLRPATAVPFWACQSLIAASICLPVDACWPVIGRMKPILNGALSCACAVAVHAAAKASAVKADAKCLAAMS